MKSWFAKIRSIKILSSFTVLQICTLVNAVYHYITVKIRWIIIFTDTRPNGRYAKTDWFGLFLGSQKAGHCARRSLWRPWKQGLRIVAWLKPRMLCEEILASHAGVFVGRDEKRAPLKTPAWEAKEILNWVLFQNVSVHEFYPFKALITLEQVNTTEWSEKKYKNLN